MRYTEHMKIRFLSEKTRYELSMLVRLFCVFCKIGALTFGGGLAMLPILTDELSIKREWTTQSELLDYFAIGQCTPGIIAVNVATFVGYKKQGVIGGIAATLGMVTPSIVVITILALFFSNFAHIRLVQKAFSGINIAVAALLAKVVWSFTKNAVHHILQALILAASFAAVLFFHVHTAWIILSAFALGAAFHLYTMLRTMRTKKRS